MSFAQTVWHLAISETLGRLDGAILPLSETFEPKRLAEVVLANRDNPGNLHTALTDLINMVVLRGILQQLRPMVPMEFDDTEQALMEANQFRLLEDTAELTKRGLELADAWAARPIDADA